MYHKYRADYPPDAIATLIARANLDQQQDVADLGSGTGILTRHLLARARIVYAVEPAEDMRRAAEENFAGETNFRSVAGMAEATSLPAQCADVITCGNSFHYFDPDRTRSEVARILRPNGRVIILFHDEPPEPDAFMRDYASFLRRHTPPNLTSVHSADSHKARVSQFFDGRCITTDSGEDEESLSWERLSGRYLSSSLANDAALGELRVLFDRHQRNGLVPLRLTWTCIACDSF